MEVFGLRQHHWQQMLLVLVILASLKNVGCVVDDAPSATRQIPVLMLGVFIAALVALVLATQSAFAAYLGVAVAKQWPEPKLSGIPYDDGIQIFCSRIEVSLYHLNVVLAILWIVGLSMYTWIWCSYVSTSCCTVWYCILVGLIFWMVPGVHICVSVFMAIKFSQLGWPVRAAETSYVPVPGFVATGVPDVVAGMPVSNT